jgi:hypothetical protein
MMTNPADLTKPVNAAALESLLRTASDRPVTG